MHRPAIAWRRDFYCGAIRRAAILLSLIFAFGTVWAEPLQVVATLFPLYDFTRQVGGNRVQAVLLLPPGIEAHAYEPTPRDILRINRADIFVFAGKSMEPWAEDVLAGSPHPRLLVVDAGQGLALAGQDPHFWLDLDLAQKAAARIAGALAQKDPAGRSVYLDNARRYQAKLAALDQRFATDLGRVRLHTFIYAGHAAFGYFGRRYHLRILSPYPGFSPDAEPSPRALAGLLRTVRQLGIRYIFYEELTDPKVARVLAAETGAKLLLLNGAHNVTREQLARGKTFVDIMEDNFRNLMLGLQ